MADNIRIQQSGEAIETISYFDTDEPGGDERPYFTIVEQERGRAGHHVSVSEIALQSATESLMPLPEEHFAATPGYSGRSLHWASILEAVHRQAGARVVLSGIGGDELLGGIQYEAPELAELLLKGRAATFFHAALAWSLVRKKTMYRLVADAVELLCGAYYPESLLPDSERPLPWTNLRPPAHGHALRTFADWRKLSPQALSMESIRYRLAQQITGTDPPLVGCVENRYPYLDRSVFCFLASVPRTQILQAGHRRHLMRRALRGIVPDAVLFRKTKWFGARSPALVLVNQGEAIDGMFQSNWLSESIGIDSKSLRKYLTDFRYGTPGDGLALQTALGIERWLRSQLKQGCVEFSSPGVEHGLT